jgi:hypothetical protein
MTFPITFGFFTDWFTFRLRGLTVSNTMRRLADSDTFRTVEHFTTFVWAFNLTFRFFTFYITNGILRLST